MCYISHVTVNIIVTVFMSAYFISYKKRFIIIWVELAHWRPIFKNHVKYRNCIIVNLSELLLIWWNKFIRSRSSRRFGLLITLLSFWFRYNWLLYSGRYSINTRIRNLYTYIDINTYILCTNIHVYKTYMNRFWW